MKPYTSLASELILSVKFQKSPIPALAELKKITLVELEEELVTQQSKLAFWLNIYNAFVQIRLQENPSMYEHRLKFFNAKNIVVAGEKLSLNIIEHGILRRSTFWWSLGYLQNPFPNKLERSWRLQSLDYRIHFALNCGAVSCPAIAFYTSEKIHEQLQLATTHFLSQTSEFNTITNTVTVSRLLSWYRGDFGGLQGVKNLLHQQGIIPNPNVKLHFAPYNWSLRLGNFS